MNTRRCLFILGALLVIAQTPTTVRAQGAGNSAGLILFDPASARAAAVGEAFSAVTNDIAAFVYNPAALRSLSSGQTSFMFQRGLADDTRGRFIIGAPIDCGGVGLNVNYYDGGQFQLINGPSKTKVRAKTDLVIGLGAARPVGPLSLGVTGKFISSEIVEEEKATAWGLDVGIQWQMQSRWSLGASMQNMGTKLRYIHERESLPQIARLGVGWKALTGKRPLLLLVEAPYFFNEEEIRPAIGAETLMGPLALRAGYKSKDSLTNFSFGLGFVVRQFSLDYSFGLVKDISDDHNVSIAMKFGRGS